MALIDDLKDYIARNSTPRTKIGEKHNVVIIGETHLGYDQCDTFQSSCFVDSLITWFLKASGI